MCTVNSFIRVLWRWFKLVLKLVVFFIAGNRWYSLELVDYTSTAEVNFLYTRTAAQTHRCLFDDVDAHIRQREIRAGPLEHFTT